MESVQSEESNTVPFFIAFLAFTIAYMFAFFGKFHAIYGWSEAITILSKPFEVLNVIFSGGAAAMGFMSEVFGRSFLIFGVIHLLISQLFKNKRNPDARRKIIVGWSVASILITTFSIYSAEQQFKVQTLLQQ